MSSWAPALHAERAPHARWGTLAADVWLGSRCRARAMRLMRLAARTAGRRQASFRPSSEALLRCSAGPQPLGLGRGGLLQDALAARELGHLGCGLLRRLTGLGVRLAGD